MSFSIVTDSAANLPTSLLNEYGISIIPLAYCYDDQEHFCYDQDNFDGDAYFEMLRNKVHVTTTLINPDRFATFFEQFLSDGQDVIYVGVSSGISGTFHSAEFAASELREKYPERKLITVDTLAASLGEGLMVLKAVRLRNEGKTIEETAEIIDSEKQLMNQILTVGDLMHLKRTGRVSGVTALIGSTLKINPLLKGSTEGVIVQYGTTIGRKRSLKALASNYADRQINAQNQTIGIAHCGCAKDAEYLAGLLNEICAPKEMIIVSYEPSTGAHVGPDTVALFFEGEKRR